MSALDQIVNVAISQSTAAVALPSFSIPSIYGPSNRFAPVTTTANTLNDSNQLSGIANLAGIVQGAAISGAGIPAGTYILSVSGTTATLSQEATATATGVTVTVTDSERSYAGGASGLAQMLADGFLTTDPEYVRAQAMNSQTVTPVEFIVGRYSASIAQVDTFAVNTLTNGHTYAFTLNGTVISYVAGGGDTQQSVLAALNAAIATAFPSNPPTLGVVNGTGGSALLTLTSSVAGAAVIYTTVDSELTLVNVTPNHTITSDIAQGQVQDNSWYGLAICSNADNDIQQVSSFIEPQTKIFLPVSNDSLIPTSSTSDLGSLLKAAGFKRTGLVFSIASYQKGVEAAWLGGLLPTTPGSSNWAFKTLAGITADSLTGGQQQACIGIPEAGVPGKNVNIYQPVGGVNITEMGTMAGGQFIDITIGVDWLKATIQTNIFSVQVNSPKIPYTDIGTSILISAVRAAIDQGVANGLIDGLSPISVTAPLVATVPKTQRANRIAPTISFTCRLQGAFNAVIVQGTVTV